jgi:hypothetical protein
MHLCLPLLAELCADEDVGAPREPILRGRG